MPCMFFQAVRGLVALVFLFDLYTIYQPSARFTQDSGGN